MLRDFLLNIEHTFLASIFAIVNIMIRPAKRNIWLYFVEFTISVVTATFVGLVGVELGFNKGLSFILVACSALLARDILSFVVGLGDYVDENKEALYKKLFKKMFDKVSK